MTYSVGTVIMISRPPEIPPGGEGEGRREKEREGGGDRGVSKKERAH